MFVLPAIAFIGGLVAMGRTKPQTTVRKLICLGPVSGIVYPVEDFPEIGTIVVRAPGGRAVAQFIRAAVHKPGTPGLVYQHGQGDAELLALMRRDFAVPMPKPAAVPSTDGGQSSPSGQSEKTAAAPAPAAPAAPAARAGRGTP